MVPVSAVILHRPAPRDAGPLERALAGARLALGEDLGRRLCDAGAAESRVLVEEIDDIPFGARLRRLVRERLPHGHGLVVAGSGAAPLATARDLAPFVTTAAGGRREALANNRYSADLVAIGDPSPLRDVPDLPADNGLPRWLAEVAGFAVSDLRHRWRLAVDVDSPLDLVLIAGGGSQSSGRPLTAEASPEDALAFDAVRDRLEAVARTLADRRREVLVAGRTSARALAWLERHAASRIRALVEERGLRASSELALASSGGPPRPTRRPRSAIGLVLDDRGPDALGAVVAELADAALIDTRVLLAHLLGADERAWPSAEDRFASDLLLPDRIADPWLAALTRSALEAPVPTVLGGHGLVGPGVRLVGRVGRR